MKTIIRTVLLLFLLTFNMTALGGENKMNDTEKKLQQFIDNHLKIIVPLDKEQRQAYWDSATTGKDEDFARLKEIKEKFYEIYKNPEEFAFIKKTWDEGKVDDLKLKRQLKSLYYSYLWNQLDKNLVKKMIDLDSKIRQTYNTYRPTVKDEKLTQSDIYDIMTSEMDSQRRQEVWEAGGKVGNVILEDLLKLVKLRNQAARELGFDNYHTYTLVSGDQEPQELDGIFAELYDLTKEPYAKMMDELNGILAEMYGESDKNNLRPWHYHDPFFQRVPLILKLDLDQFYKKHDVKVLSEKYFQSIGLPVNDILARSDLYEREGKNPHAFSQDMGREGKARVLCNLMNTERWMETILHELGHAVYSKYHSLEEPFMLRSPAHSFTTEGVAMFYGRLSRNADWMKQMLNLTEAEYEEMKKVSTKYSRFQQLIFARWAMVMYHFEKQLYENPDQDLNTLWWDMKEQYQLLNRPAGNPNASWASKLHFVQAPCYYHNYMLGEIFASQVHHHLVHDVIGAKTDEGVSFLDDPRIGRYMRKNIFEPGSVFHWNEMTRRATGENLTARFFVEQFVN